MAPASIIAADNALAAVECEKSAARDRSLSSLWRTREQAPIAHVKGQYRVGLFDILAKLFLSKAFLTNVG